MKKKIKMKLSSLIASLEDLFCTYGDAEVTCKAGDSYFPTRSAHYDGDENEIVIECKDLNY